MKQSEKEALLKEIQSIIHQEVSPVLDILMDYMDVRFDAIDERFFLVFGGVNRLIEDLKIIFDPPIS